MMTYHTGSRASLTLDDEGVYYDVEQKRFYVHDQVVIVAIKRGQMDRIQPAFHMRLFVRSRSNPQVRQY